MHLKTWQSEDICQERSDGGYGLVSRRARENLELERKSQKMLKSLSSTKISKVTINQVVVAKLSNTKMFLIDILPLVFVPALKNKQLSQWSVRSEPHHFEEVRATPKEKIKLQAESKEWFTWFGNLTDPSVDFAYIEPFKKDCNPIEELRLEFNFLTHRETNRGYIRFRPMQSKLENRFQGLTDESLGKSVSFGLPEKPVIEDFHFVIRMLDTYLLDSVRRHQPVEGEKKVALDRWPSENASMRETYFEQLYEGLFDVEFNKLDFFKFKVLINEKKTKKRSLLKRIWRIPKEQVKKLEWNPFNYLKNCRTKNLIANDIIVCTNFKIQQAPLIFHQIRCNSLDLIDFEKKTFGTLKFVMNIPLQYENKPNPIDCPEETMIQSVTSEENTLDCHIMNTSLLPQKRSFIDDDLKTIVENKKKIIKGTDTADSSTETLPFSIRLLRGLNRGMNNEEIGKGKNLLRDKNESSPRIHTPQLPFLTVDIENSRRTVIINSNRIGYNHKIIEFLTNATKLQVNEQEMYSNCDFIVNPVTCIIRAQLNKFFQVEENGILFYEKLLTDLLSEFKKVIIFVEYPTILELADKDIFWKFRLFLRNPQFEVYLTSDSHRDIGKWILAMAFAYGDEYNDEDLNFADEDEEVLLQLNFNRFLLKLLLGSYTLSEILLMATSDQSELSNLLTPYQLQRLQCLTFLEWSEPI